MTNRSIKLCNKFKNNYFNSKNSLPKTANQNGYLIKKNQSYCADCLAIKAILALCSASIYSISKFIFFTVSSCIIAFRSRTIFSLSVNPVESRFALLFLGGSFGVKVVIFVLVVMFGWKLGLELELQASLEDVEVSWHGTLSAEDTMQLAVSSPSPTSIASAIAIPILPQTRN